MKFEWKITGLKKLNDPSTELNDIIVQTYWTCTGTDEEGNKGTFTGAMPFEPDQVDPENFTTYENLTETQVLEWITDRVLADEGYWNHIQTQIKKQIHLTKNLEKQVQENDLPWAQTINNGEL